MALSNEMRRLTKEFLAAYDDRTAMVATICSNTAQELSRFHAAHEYMAAEQRQRLTDYVNGLRDNVTTMLDSMNTTHEQMAAEQRKRMADCVDGLRNNVATILKSLDAAHTHMATEQRRRLAGYVNGLRCDVTTVLKSLDAAHERMAADQHKRLAAGRRRLTSDVNKMRGSLQADQNKARETWNSFAAKMQNRRARKFTSPSTAGASQTVKKSPTAAKSTKSADDFTSIAGIGPGWQQRLNEMGIRTFAQLAGSTPKEIQKALGTAGHLAKVEQWIKEAKKRS